MSGSEIGPKRGDGGKACPPCPQTSSAHSFRSLLPSLHPALWLFSESRTSNQNLLSHVLVVFRPLTKEHVLGLHMLGDGDREKTLKWAPLPTYNHKQIKEKDLVTRYKTNNMPGPVLGTSYFI